MASQEKTYREYAPSPELRPFIDCYWSYAAVLTPEIRARNNPIIPDGCVDIIFDLNLPADSECFVVGPMTRPIQNAKDNLFGIRFKPGMAALKKLRDDLP